MVNETPRQTPRKKARKSNVRIIPISVFDNIDQLLRMLVGNA